MCWNSPKKNGESNLNFVDQVSKEISKRIKGYTVIVSKSTVPVGTSKRIENILRKKNSQKTYDVVSNPEFLREGSALEDFTRPDKIIIGCRSEKAEKMLNDMIFNVKRGNKMKNYSNCKFCPFKQSEYCNGAAW